VGLTSASDKDVPFNTQTMTHLRITSKEDMTQLSKSFISLKYTGIASLNQSYAGIDVSFSNTFNVFVGYKNASDSIRQLEFDNNCRDTGYLQLHQARESFAYHTYDPKSQKNNKKFSHSLYKNVHNYDNSICGKYLNLEDFAAGGNGHYSQPFEFTL
jgi:hypothetical protein